MHLNIGKTQKNIYGIHKDKVLKDKNLIILSKGIYISIKKVKELMTIKVGIAVASGGKERAVVWQ